MSREPCCDFNDFVKAMADGTRQRILLLLQDGEMNVNEINQHFHVEQPTTSYRLRILRQANLVVARRSGRQVFYRGNLACIAECCNDIVTRFELSISNDSQERIS